jgi:hypothetical protein
MDKGNIAKMRPEQFLLNFISLTSFPVSMRPLLQETMGFSGKLRPPAGRTQANNTGYAFYKQRRIVTPF